MRKYLVALLFLLAGAPAFASMADALDAYKKGDYGTAIRELNRLGEAGDMSAQVMLGALYSRGGAVTRDDKIAASWFERAAFQDNAEAQYQLGYLYENSELPRDYVAATNWYHKAAQRGSAKAQARLGILYAAGLGVTKNTNEALLWFGKAALRGNTDAQFSLGRMYAVGKIVPKNQDLAKGWLTKAAAQGHADSLLMLAGMYKKGEGVPKDPILAYALNSLAIKNQTLLKKNATNMREDLADELTPEQLNTSNKLSQELQKPQQFSQVYSAYLTKAHQPPFRFFDRPAK